jgi:ankyrin repeat protein
MTKNDEDMPEAFRACLEKTSNQLRRLLQRGLDPNLRTAEDESLLSYAIVWHRVGSVRALLDAHVDVEQLDSKWSPLMYAADEGLVEVAEWLVKAGADIRRKDDHGRSAADLAEARGYTELAMQLRA